MSQSVTRRIAVFVGFAAVAALMGGQAFADHTEDPEHTKADCSYASHGRNTSVEAADTTVYAGPNSSGTDPEETRRVAVGTCSDRDSSFQGTNEVVVDPDTLYYHAVSDGGEGNHFFFDGWFGVWNCGGAGVPDDYDNPRGNWHDDNGPCGETPPEPHNECPAEERDPSDNRLSIQTGLGGVCYDLADLSCAHIWVDGTDANGFPLGAFASAGNDHPSNEEGCGDSEADEPDDGRSAHPGICGGLEGGPDSGTDEPICGNPGDILDEYGISLGSELDECRNFATGQPSNPDHSQPGVCADDDGDGIPDPQPPGS